MALVCLCRGNFYWPPHTTILFCSIFLDKIVLDTLKSRYHRSAPLGILYRTSKKQDTEVGKLLTNTVLLIYILRIVFTALSDIGVLPNFFMCVPFVVTGGMFIIYDMALVGIILSVNRNESIAKDWIKLKSKRNAAKNGGQL